MIHDIMLVPLEVAYRVTERLGVVDGYAVHHAHDIPDRLDRLRFMVTPVSMDPHSLYATFAPSAEIVLRRKLYRSETHLEPRARRTVARARTWGRRGAKPVPIAVRQELSVYAPDGMPDTIAIAAAHDLGKRMSAIWRCPWWRRGAPIWTMGRDR